MTKQELKIIGLAALLPVMIFLLVAAINLPFVLAGGWIVLSILGLGLFGGILALLALRANL